MPHTRRALLLLIVGPCTLGASGQGVNPSPISFSSLRAPALVVPRAWGRNPSPPTPRRTCKRACQTVHTLNWGESPTSMHTGSESESHFSASQTHPREPNVKATHPRHKPTERCIGDTSNNTNDRSEREGDASQTQPTERCIGTHRATRTKTSTVTDWIRHVPIELPAESHAHVCTQRPPDSRSRTKGNTRCSASG